MRKMVLVALAALMAAGSTAYVSGCSGTPQVDDGDEVQADEEAALRGDIGFDRNSGAVLKKIGIPQLARGPYRLAYKRNFLSAAGGWAPRSFGTETLEVLPDEGVDRHIKRTLPSGDVVEAVTDARGVTEDVIASERLTRFQLPNAALIQNRPYPILGLMASPERAEQLSSVEYAQSVAALGTVKKDLVVTAFYINRRDLAGQRSLRIQGGKDEGAVQAGIGFGYWLNVPGSGLLPIGQLTLLYPADMPEGAPLDRESGVLAFQHVLDPAKSTFASPQIASAVKRALAWLPAKPARWNLAYVKGVPLRPCWDGRCGINKDCP